MKGLYKVALLLFLVNPKSAFSQFDYLHNSYFEINSQMHQDPSPAKYLTLAAEGLKGKVKVVRSCICLPGDSISVPINDLYTDALKAIIAYLQELSYDNSGNKVHYVFFGNNRDYQGPTVNKTTYSYNTEGKIIRTENRDCFIKTVSGNSSCDLYDYEYRYDKSGHLFSESRWLKNKYSQQKYLKNEHIKYQYDEQDRLVKIISLRRVPGYGVPAKTKRLRRSEKEIFIINEKDSTVSSSLKVSRKFKNSTIRKSGTTTWKYKYNAEGKLLEWNNSNHKTYWKYNEKGQLLETNANVNSARYIYEYDERGNTIRVSTMHPSGSIYVHVVYENFDNKGNWLKATYSGRGIMIREIEYHQPQPE